MNIPYYIPNIPHSTLTAIYNTTDTNFELFEHILAPQLFLDISSQIDDLADTLNQAYYIPDLPSPAYCQTLQFQSATCFALHGTSPYSRSTPLKQILFRAQHADMLALHTLKAHEQRIYNRKPPPPFLPPRSPPPPPPTPPHWEPTPELEPTEDHIAMLLLSLRQLIPQQIPPNHHHNQRQHYHDIHHRRNNQHHRNYHHCQHQLQRQHHHKHQHK